MIIIIIVIIIIIIIIISIMKVFFTGSWTMVGDCGSWPLTGSSWNDLIGWGQDAFPTC